ncbi:MAG TPA: RagB/SusD family nutrient uptake outer membrane protein [Cytophagales bacterium]|nr:RagB/SusD family nutrient uptake outer membrane protein [Cytophagales bacterium]
MKKILYIGLIPLILLTSSCEDFLDEQPVSELSADKFWKSEGDIRAGIAGMYDGFQGVVSGTHIEWGGARSDNWTHGGTSTEATDFTNNSLQSGLDEVDWSQLYTTIHRANLAIKYLPTITGGDISETNKNNYLAQAYAMRAYCYFLGAKIWGDVPLILQPISDRDFKPTRTAVDVVLDSVIVDLDKALELVNPDNDNVFEINIGGILAMQTDVYMWQHDYQKAIEATDKLIDLGRYDLAENASDWKEMLIDPNTSNEPIWAIYWLILEDGGSGIADKIGSSDHTSPFIIDPNLVVKWSQQKGDYRRGLTYDTLAAQSDDGAQDTWKYYPLDPVSKEPGQSVPKGDFAEIRPCIYRLADILLLRAEAFNQLSNEPGAVTLLNEVRVARGLDGVEEDDFNTIEELETAILDERQFELFAEGKRWFDLRRTGRVAEVMNPLLDKRAVSGETVTKFIENDPRFLFPIFEEVLIANPKLEQNVPYSR